ncbi:MAG: enoyl-CoA hydratase [Ferrovum sp. 37-45-19]|uniref:bifunctional enoyl-CoA hydratase/phosphate acetyltransferase n=1 Tax=Ferrovum sp. JA12 TaxID=1356299 RepID=UPI0007038A32|nr:bifunctional enoyl-CoA hydratase/phosphate acetyltransferase [Ferrovum sp. JA12]OYV93940.1 MAG: enoyl-CoA hydratase [Ferrovum sp. 37-45-19]OZB31992.1 MAG: enoyl-CoA hydratase [Ferrovum sp. 34-44-207]HQT81998.1 bifunctional enoyl-CoA hydratase/phosphate acetyltransferase [Ferrovaceae bacterium]KRH78981.1 phosphate acetyltransferase [Ferrovum sp. JA12]HQU07122.1 bifunctional enoyl-CoA hydratase/phosphate acetyltransferase [Ferrovaceae bacterium]
MTLNNELLENVPFDEINIGQSTKLTRTFTDQDSQEFAGISQDLGQNRADSNELDLSGNLQLMAYGSWISSLVSRLVATHLPGSGSQYHAQSFRFIKPIQLGDTVSVKVTVKEKDSLTKLVTLHCLVDNQHGETLVTGEVTVRAPLIKITPRKIIVSSQKDFDPLNKIREFLRLTDNLAPIVCGVVHPCDQESLAGVIEAAQHNLIIPILIGSSYKINQVAEASQLDIKAFTIIDTPHSHASAEVGASMAETGQVEALMKGSLHTDELMHAVLENKHLRTKRRVSHIFRFEVPLYSKPILISDAALNIKPNLLEKKDIVQNAIDLSYMLQQEHPYVAILSAIETINPDIPSTMDAAALCKMADRGQITGGVLDGPLAFDNAISFEAKRIKHLVSSVAGQADILIVPDLESGNMLSKQLEYLSGAVVSGVVLGCKVPIALTSRADGPATRTVSAALAKLVAHHYRKTKP